MSVNGFINLIKPSGPTSSDMVVRVRRIYKADKVGHMGTLDPLAAGVLVIALGKATRLFDYLTNKIKKYRAQFTFGIETDTIDSDGKITNTSSDIPIKEQVEKALEKFRGKITQVPPKYSAIKINGRKAYDLARQGQDFDIASKQVHIYKFELLSYENNVFTFDINCSGGTYIRSLCADLASELGTVAYMSMLIRTDSGCFNINEGLTLEDLANSDNKEQLIIPYEKVLSDVQKIVIPDNLYKQLDNGIKIKTQYKDISNALIYCKNQLFGLGSIKNEIVSIDTYLKS